MASDKINKLEEQLLTAKDGFEKIDLLNTLALELLERDFKHSQDLAEQALKLSRPPELDTPFYPLGTAQALITLGELANQSNNFGLALTHLFEANALLQDLSCPELLAKASHMSGWFHYKLGNFTESADFLEKAKKIFHELGNREKESEVLSSLGSLYNTQGNHAKSLKFYTDALTLQREQGATRSHAVTLNNLAIAQMNVGTYDEALSNAQASHTIVRKLDLPSLEATVLETIGQVYLARGDTHEAIAIYQTCLNLAQGAEVIPIVLEATLNLGKVYIKQGLLDKARDHFIQAVSMTEGRKQDKHRSLYHEMLTQIYEKQGDLQKAFFHYKEYHAAWQNVLADSTRYRLENLKIMYQEEKTRKEAELLWLQNQALEQEIGERLNEHARLEKLAITDPLTGLYNRRHFFTLGEYNLEKSHQTARPLSLIFLDIDHFKQVNDNYDHATGDLVLKRIAQLLSTSVRKEDIVCRIGGEEFVILLPNTRLANGQDVAERIRLAVSSAPIQIEQATIPITASLGVIELSANDHDLAALLARSDEALFRAKSAGRNRVSL